MKASTVEKCFQVLLVFDSLGKSLCQFPYFVIIFTELYIFIIP